MIIIAITASITDFLSPSIVLEFFYNWTDKLKRKSVHELNMAFDAFICGKLAQIKIIDFLIFNIILIILEKKISVSIDIYLIALYLNFSYFLFFTSLAVEWIFNFIIFSHSLVRISALEWLAFIIICKAIDWIWFIMSILW